MIWKDTVMDCLKVLVSFARKTGEYREPAILTRSGFDPGTYRIILRLICAVKILKRR
jgi:hypothetical protein